MSFGVNLNWKLSEIGESCIPKASIVALASHTHFEDICDFQMPEARHPSAGPTESVEDLIDSLSGLFAVNPSQSQ
jgi:hypothetical protein